MRLFVTSQPQVRLHLLNNHSPEKHVITLLPAAEHRVLFFNDQEYQPTGAQTIDSENWEGDGPSD